METARRDVTDPWPAFDLLRGGAAGRNGCGRDIDKAAAYDADGTNEVQQKRNVRGMKQAWILSSVLGVFLVVGGSARGTDTDASAPVRTTLSLYDRDFALVQELRRVTLTRGENTVRFGELPARLDPESVSLAPLSGPGGLDVQEQQFAYDLAELSRLLERYRGKEVRVRADGETAEGRLVVPPGLQEKSVSSVPLTLGLPDGSALSFLNLDAVDRITFPNADADAYLEPTLLWNVVADEEGPQNLRLTYVADNMTWACTYECILSEDGSEAYLSGRVAIRNRSGGAYHDARVKLVVTEKGSTPPILSRGADRPSAGSTAALRFGYGASEPTFERLTASAGTVETYPLERGLTIGSGETRMVQLFSAGKVPVRRFFVYDGVRFDRFQRNRRNDWGYGTEYHETVETHIQFENEERVGLGQRMPPGRFRLYQVGEEAIVDLVGEDAFVGAAAGAAGHIMLGPARGLRGERERSGYGEIVPLHEYEESFEIRLENDTKQEAEIRVVEHLYRWPEFEIARSDTEYEQTGPQTIEFRPVLKPGGKRAIHYSVRYTW